MQAHYEFVLDLKQLDTLFRLISAKIVTTLLIQLSQIIFGGQWLRGRKCITRQKHDGKIDSGGEPGKKVATHDVRYLVINKIRS